jgi:hypothetical protein
MSWQAIEYAYDERSGLYRRVSTTTIAPFVVALVRDSVANELRSLLPCPCVRVTNSRELATEASKPGAIIFVEWDLLCHIDADMTQTPIVALTDDSNETLPRLIRSLDAFGWLSHFLSQKLLSQPTAKQHLARLIEQLAIGVPATMIGEARVALLACTAHRDARFERIRMFFAERGVTVRSLERISEVYEELVTNALYDAPMEAGYFSGPIARTDDVELPREHACEISYGLHDSIAYIRVRDTFGALDRERMVSVLRRCNMEGVALDESRGGAGLGLWRVFSAASTIAVTVVPGQLTEIIVGIVTKERRGTGPLAVDVYFGPTEGRQRRVVSDHDPLDQSITLIRVS